MSELKAFEVGLGRYCKDGSPCVVAFATGRTPRALNEKIYLKNEVDKVIAEKDAEIRRLQRALWMHRAITAKLNKDGCKAMREYNPMIGIEEYLWQEVERKCRAKAEEYK